MVGQEFLVFWIKRLQVCQVTLNRILGHVSVRNIPGDTVDYYFDSVIFSPFFPKFFYGLVNSSNEGFDFNLWIFHIVWWEDPQIPETLIVSAGSEERILREFSWVQLDYHIMDLRGPLHQFSKHFARGQKRPQTRGPFRKICRTCLTHISVQKCTFAHPRGHFSLRSKQKQVLFSASK